MPKSPVAPKPPNPSATRAMGECACGAVRLEIEVPAVWAWHDHSAAGRRAHGCAYATYVGSWRSRFRVTKGATKLTRYEDPATGAARSFCAGCGTPLIYERARAPRMVNIPRAVFTTRTGREPRYHIAIEETADWEYRGEALAPLKGYPGVMWERPGRRKAREVVRSSVGAWDDGTA
ncbi:MAG: GFA family protein [Caulobacteraceae bacterium]